MKIAIVGLGLIGGSLAKSLKGEANISTVLGVEANAEHRKLIEELQLVDELLPLDEALASADVIFLCTPVKAIMELLPLALSSNKNAVVIDMCSTKESICAAIESHENRGQFVAAHPMAGTEYSGPAAAIENLFTQKRVIICDKEKTNTQALATATSLFNLLDMKIEFMAADQHDINAAYVSHISHVSSFALALAVLDIEEGNAGEIERMASGGFRSTVRLAKSSPATWSQILIDNNENVLTTIAAFEAQLNRIKHLLENQDEEGMKHLIRECNAIRPIVDQVIPVTQN